MSGVRWLLRVGCTDSVQTPGMMSATGSTAAEHTDAFCVACKHNRTIPDLSAPENLLQWRKMELAKAPPVLYRAKASPAARHRPGRPERVGVRLPSPSLGQADATVLTGHAGGLITLNLTEADDPERERQRKMGELYRTVLGHFRHEIAHYFWDRLVANGLRFGRIPQLFGDEQLDYTAALQRITPTARRPIGPSNFVSAYASTHPWEDFAETWAHYFHIVDTLETAGAFGLSVRPRVAKGNDLAAKVDFDPHHGDMDRLVEAWLPLTFAVNSINRSMGLSDLYPFVLSPAVVSKLGFVHERIHASSSHRAREEGHAPKPASLQSTAMS